MKKHFIILVSVMSLALSGLGQDNKETYSGISINISKTNRGSGIGLHYSFGEDLKHYLISLDVYSVKHIQEVSINSNFGSDLGRKFTFGKLNYFFVATPSFGIQKTLIPKNSLNIMNVRGGLKIGPAIGLLSPYYLDIYRPNQSGGGIDNRSVEAYDPAIHTYNRIFGRARVLTSNLNINARIGLSLKAFTLLDFARNQRFIQGVSLGLNADLFVNPIPLMAELDKLQNQRIFVAGLIGVMIGNRW